MKKIFLVLLLVALASSAFGQGSTSRPAGFKRASDGYIYSKTADRGYLRDATGVDTTLWYTFDGTVFWVIPRIDNAAVITDSLYTQGDFFIDGSMVFQSAGSIDMDGGIIDEVAIIRGQTSAAFYVTAQAGYRMYLQTLSNSDIHFFTDDAFIMSTSPTNTLSGLGDSTSFIDDCTFDGDIGADVVELDDIAQNGAADGQVIKWNQAGTEWIVANDLTGGGAGGFPIVQEQDITKCTSAVTFDFGPGLNADTTIGTPTEAEITLDYSGNPINFDAGSPEVSGTLPQTYIETDITASKILGMPWEDTASNLQDGYIPKWNYTSHEWEYEADNAAGAGTYLPLAPAIGDSLTEDLNMSGHNIIGANGITADTVHAAVYNPLTDAGDLWFGNIAGDTAAFYWWNGIDGAMRLRNDTLAGLGSSPKITGFSFGGTFEDDVIKDTDIDWGKGANQVSAVDLPDFNTSDTTAGNIFVADGTDFESVAMSGDVGIASGGATTIQTGAVDSLMLQHTGAGAVTVTGFRDEGNSNRLLFIDNNNDVSGDVALGDAYTLVRSQGTTSDLTMSLLLPQSLDFTAKFAFLELYLGAITDTTEADSAVLSLGTIGTMLGDYVPYTGATGEVDLNAQNLVNADTVAANMVSAVDSVVTQKVVTTGDSSGSTTWNGATSGSLTMTVRDVVDGGYMSTLANDTMIVFLRDPANDSSSLRAEGVLSIIDAGYIKFVSDGSDPAWGEGLLYWDNDNECIAYHSMYDGVSNQVGQEMWMKVRVPTDSATILDGKAVRIIGGAPSLPTIGLAKATSPDSANCVGLTTMDIAGGANGFVTSYGEVRGLTTNGVAGAADGVMIWLSGDTAGAWVTTKPAIVVPVGYITNSHASLGIIQVDRHHNVIQPEDVFGLDTASVGYSDSTGAAVASDIIMDPLGAPTFSTLQQMHNIFHSCGWISDGAFTDTTDGAGDVDSLYIAAGTGLIRASDLAVDTNTILFFDWGDTTIAIPADTTLFLGVKYNAGTPVVFDTTADKSFFDYQQNFELGAVTNEGGVLHITFNPHAIGDHATTMIERTQGTMGIQRDNDIGGIILGETGTRNPTVSAGVLYSKLNAFSISAIDLSSSGSMDRYYQDGSGGWTKEASQTQWNNTQYDDGDGGLATINNNRYSNQYFYIELDGALISLYGQGEYVSLAGADAETAPATVPKRLTVNQGILIGRILFQEGAATASEIQTVFTTTFSGTLVSGHNNLGDLQGGAASEYYHLTSTEYSALGAVPDSAAVAARLNGDADTYLNIDTDTAQFVADDIAVVKIYPNATDQGVIANPNGIVIEGGIGPLLTDSVATSRIHSDTVTVATQLTIPFDANPTTDAEGEMAWDSDDDMIEVYSGNESESVVIPIYDEKSFFIYDPENFSDSLPLIDVGELKWPGGIEIDSIQITIDADAAYSVQFMTYTNADPPVFDAWIDTVTTGASDQKASSVVFYDGNEEVAAGKTVYYGIPTTDIGWVMGTVWFHGKDND